MFQRLGYFFASVGYPNKSMLKALELVGFKSFSDKTRFEFPKGITCVVGPNGSGKSNVVDAIKWVLGEQSAKTLRGKEMADVIFNGSSTRPPMNSAEATLTVDNSAGLLPIDSPEVHITRRVYRSGESEYLINRQPGRLRDIRDLFAGTGAATEAYSVIEQGKVDVLLQASPRDRRAIFEEAAGISRFKAKKLESLRRLERVQQNLVRLGDIVQEVENQLRSVRLQATKAQRYRNYADRLQQLRTQIGLSDWRHMTERLEALQAEMQTLHEESALASAEAESHETRSLELETAAARATEAIRTCESRISENRERIASNESTIEHQRLRLRELESEEARHRRQLAALNSRVGNLQQQFADVEAAVNEAEEENRRASQKVAADERTLTELTAELDRLRIDSEQHRDQYLDRARQSAALENEIETLRSEQKDLAQRQEKLHDRQIQYDAQQAQHQTAVEELERLTNGLSSRSKRLQAELQEVEQQHTARRDQCETVRKELADVQQQRSVSAARLTVLEELEQRFEGVSAGAKEVLLEAREKADGPWQQVHGLVADLFRVQVETAPLIEVALGERAQYIVVGPGQRLWDHLANHAQKLHGRAGFLRLEPLSVLQREEVDLSDAPGVVGRADHYVEAAPEHAPLARRLLGQTWIVENLSDALALASSQGQGLTFVTLAGELLVSDGSLLVGGRTGSTGLISRRSELRSLRSQIEALSDREKLLSSQFTELETEVTTLRKRLDSVVPAHREASDALGQHRLKLDTARQQAEASGNQSTENQIDYDAVVARHMQTESRLETAVQTHEQAQAQLIDLQQQVEQTTIALTNLDRGRSDQEEKTTGAKIQLATSEERFNNFRAQLRSLEQSREDRRRAVSDIREQIARCGRQFRESESRLLELSSAVAELYLRKENDTQETFELITRRESLHTERNSMTQIIQRARSRTRKAEEQLHERELAANEIRLQRDAIETQLRDEYEIELAELKHEPTEKEQHARDEVEQEIAELRRKLNNIGNVNLDALDELDALESRFELLSGQYGDLCEAKESLERIITRINTDSRRMFADTLEVVRGHFQTLFRKLFGGGHADIVIDDETDLLESGIEIVARPPGKEPRSISLLSGGEKTLTCVALLLAIFRSKPSPFCVLDEVDAALDEANIERFITVLKEFLEWTQFIVVTHSKKTMTCANTLYGVTMQESGVSKRVSVHFDDVSEDGQIRDQAGRDSDDTAAA